MSAGNASLFAFNRGLISPLALARTDVKRLALSAEIQTNWVPRTLGSMMLRPGMQYISATRNNLRARFLPFVFSTSDIALIECTDMTLRIVNPGPDGAPSTLLSRPAVRAAITNGSFAGSLAGWTNADQLGATSQWAAGNQMALVGTGFNAGVEYQLVTVLDPGVEHAVRIVVTRGRVVLAIGTSPGDRTYADNLNLEMGTHSIAFTPGGNFYVQFSNATVVSARISSVQIEAAGIFTLPTPWATADLQRLRTDQSGEVVYVACEGKQQHKLQRWGAKGNLGEHSWSIVLFKPMDGPFRAINTTPATMAVSGSTGDVSLTCSVPFFHPGHVGALFKLTSIGQNTFVAASGAQQFTSAIQATGLASGAGRAISFAITGTFAGTVVLQRSVAQIGAWEDVPGQSWTGPITGAYNDGLDNQIIFYRLGIGAAYTSGVANCFIGIPVNAITGICEVTAFVDATTVLAQVLIQPNNTGVLTGMGSTTPTSQWYEGQWSGVRGYPTSVALYEGRLGWAGKNAIVLSVSDAYESYDDTVVGDSGPINRTVGSGPVDVINWLLPLADLVAGAQAAEMDIRSSILGGILTPSDLVIKNCSTQGSASVPALRMDNDGFFLQRSGRRIYKLTYTPSYLLMNYRTTDVTNFVPDLAVSELGVKMAVPGVNWIALQRQPDTRLHAILNDGTVRTLIINPDEDEQCWIKVETSGMVEDIIVLPGQGGANSEDLVYYVVTRTVNGQPVRYLERWALEEECWGGTVTKCVDSHVSGAQAASKTIGGLGHLVGRQVVCWADGQDQGGPFTVSAAGTITVGSLVSEYCVGLAYSAPFRSSKLTYAAEMGTALTEKKRVSSLGFVLQNVHYQGLRYGKDFDSLQDLPAVYKGAAAPPNTVYVSYDDAEFPFGGGWDTDSRICLQAASPRPCTVLAAVIGLETRESI